VGPSVTESTRQEYEQIEERFGRAEVERELDTGVSRTFQ